MWVLGDSLGSQHSLMFLEEKLTNKSLSDARKADLAVKQEL